MPRKNTHPGKKRAKPKENRPPTEERLRKEDGHPHTFRKDARRRQNYTDPFSGTIMNSRGMTTALAQPGKNKATAKCAGE